MQKNWKDRYIILTKYTPSKQNQTNKPKNTNQQTQTNQNKHPKNKSTLTITNTQVHNQQ